MLAAPGRTTESAIWWKHYHRPVALHARHDAHGLTDHPWTVEEMLGELTKHA
jgi:hypothetical protein